MANTTPGAPNGAMAAWAQNKTQQAAAPQRENFGQDDPGPNAKCPFCHNPITLVVADAGPPKPPAGAPPAPGAPPGVPPAAPPKPGFPPR